MRGVYQKTSKEFFDDFIIPAIDKSITVIDRFYTVYFMQYYMSYIFAMEQGNDRMNFQ